MRLNVGVQAKIFLLELGGLCPWRAGISRRNLLYSNTLTGRAFNSASSHSISSPLWNSTWKTMKKTTPNSSSNNQEMRWTLEQAPTQADCSATNSTWLVASKFETESNRFQVFHFIFVRARNSKKTVLTWGKGAYRFGVSTGRIQVQILCLLRMPYVRACCCSSELMIVAWEVLNLSPFHLCLVSSLRSANLRLSVRSVVDVTICWYVVMESRSGGAQWTVVLLCWKVRDDETRRKGIELFSKNLFAFLLRDFR